MDLTVTPGQLDAIRGAKHLPDVLARVCDAATPTSLGAVLHLSYEEATALQELCAWSVKTDAAGAVTPETRIFDDLVKSILTHPDY